MITPHDRMIAAGLVVIMVATGCAQPVPPLSPRGSGVREALNAINVDSICGSPCSVVVVDTVVRESRKLLPYRPRRAPVFSYLSPEDLRVLDQPSRSVIPGPILVDGARSDTIEIGLYLVHSQSPLDEDRMYGVTVWPPGLSGRVLFVALDSVGDGWKVKQTGVYMEP